MYAGTKIIKIYRARFASERPADEPPTHDVHCKPAAAFQQRRAYAAAPLGCFGQRACHAARASRLQLQRMACTAVHDQRAGGARRVVQALVQVAAVDGAPWTVRAAGCMPRQPCRVESRAAAVNQSQ
jgi:hypothetical protein